MKRVRSAIPLIQVDNYYDEFHALKNLVEKLTMIRKLHKLNLKK